LGRGFVCALWLVAGIARQTDLMLMFGDQQVGPMWGRPDHPDSSVAPATHSARVSVATIAPRSKARDLFHALPKLTGFINEVGQYTWPPSSTQLDCTAGGRKKEEGRGKG
jgi:hypothetical protein